MAYRIELEDEHLETLSAVLTCALVSTLAEAAKTKDAEQDAALAGALKVAEVGDKVFSQAAAQGMKGASDEASQVKTFIMQGTNTVN